MKTYLIKQKKSILCVSEMCITSLMKRETASNHKHYNNSSEIKGSLTYEVGCVFCFLSHSFIKWSVSIVSLQFIFNSSFISALHLGGRRGGGRFSSCEVLIICNPFRPFCLQSCVVSWIKTSRCIRRIIISWTWSNALWVICFLFVTFFIRLRSTRELFVRLCSVEMLHKGHDSLK